MGQNGKFPSRVIAAGSMPMRELSGQHAGGGGRSAQVLDTEKYSLVAGALPKPCI